MIEFKEISNKENYVCKYLSIKSRYLSLSKFFIFHI